MEKLKLTFSEQDIAQNIQRPCSPGFCPSPSGELTPGAGRKWYRQACHR